MNLSCAIAPVVSPAPTCGLSSSSVTVGSSPSSVPATIGTTAPVTGGVRPPFVLPPGGWPWIGAFLLVGFAGIYLGSKKRVPVLAVPMVLVAAALCVSCGGSSSSSHGTSSGTPAGTYTATITATSGSLRHTASVTVVVQ